MVNSADPRGAVLRKRKNEGEEEDRGRKNEGEEEDAGRKKKRFASFYQIHILLIVIIFFNC